MILASKFKEKRELLFSYSFDSYGKENCKLRVKNLKGKKKEMEPVLEKHVPQQKQWHLETASSLSFLSIYVMSFYDEDGHGSLELHF